MNGGRRSEPTSERTSAVGRLTPKQTRFVAHYLVHYNGTRAAMEAGYSQNPDSARAHATKMLAKAHISEAILARQRRVTEKLEVDADMVVSGLAAIAFTNMDDVSPWTEEGCVLVASANLPVRARGAVKGLRVRRSRRVEGRGAEQEPWEIEEVEWRMHDKVAALKLLGQHLGLFPRGLRIRAETGSSLTVDARTQRINLEALEKLSIEELLAIATQLPPEPDEAV
ncbi:MAG: terminase small subunit [Dehalococcoidia bacterium]